MNSDIYWTYLCIQSINNNDETSFFYSLNFIHDSGRQQHLLTIKNKHDSGDSEVNKTISSITKDVQFLIHYV